jgi:hypothetical protein
MQPIAATCKDTTPAEPGNQAYVCPPGFIPKPGSEMATPPGNSSCCNVSVLRQHLGRNVNGLHLHSTLLVSDSNVLAPVVVINSCPVLAAAAWYVLECGMLSVLWPTIHSSSLAAAC